jgi:hypothetical protein
VIAVPAAEFFAPGDQPAQPFEPLTTMAAREGTGTAFGTLHGRAGLQFAFQRRLTLIAPVPIVVVVAVSCDASIFDTHLQRS